MFLKQDRKIPPKKLNYIISVFLVFVPVCYLLGASVGPSLFIVATLKPNKCYIQSFDKHNTSSGNPSKSIDCKSICDLKSLSKKNITMNDVVFVFPFSQELRLKETGAARWISSFKASILFNEDYKLDYSGEKKNMDLSMIANLAYKHEHQGIKVTDKSIQTRKLSCVADETGKIDGYSYGCNNIPLFELTSVQLNEYQLNIRFPASDKDYLNHVGHLKNLMLRVVYENVLFTKLKTYLKSINLIMIIIGNIAFFQSIQMKPILLLEKVMMVHGIFMSTVNTPFEFIPLFTFLLSGLDCVIMYMYHITLFLTWALFYGLFTKDEKTRNNFDSYFQYFVPLCMFITIFMLDYWERSAIIVDPFYYPGNIMQARQSTEFLYLSVFCALLYFVFIIIQFRVLKQSTRVVSGMIVNAQGEVLYEGGPKAFGILRSLVIITIVNTLSQFWLDQWIEISAKDQGTYDIRGDCIVSLPGMYMFHFGFRSILNFGIYLLYLPVEESFHGYTVVASADCKVHGDSSKSLDPFEAIEEYLIWLRYNRRQQKFILTVSPPDASDTVSLKMDELRKKEEEATENNKYPAVEDMNFPPPPPKYSTLF